MLTNTKIGDTKKYGYAQRGLLSDTLKRENGNLSKGTNGVNTMKTTEYRPERDGPVNMTKLPGQPGDSPLMSFLSKIAGGSGLGKTGSGNTGLGGSFAGAFQGLMGMFGGGSDKETKGTEQSQDQGQGLTFGSDYMAEANKLMTQLQQIVNTPFQFDYKTDPTYIAAVEAAKKGAAQATDSTLATMADRGILNSSVTSNQLGQIEQEAKEAPLQLVPGLEQNAYSRHQQGVSNQASLIQTLLQQGQWQTGFEADQKWMEADHRLREADVDGTYESPEMLKLMEDIVGYKRGWHETEDPAERARIAEAGKTARATLAGLTGRSDIEQLFGAKVGADQALANFGKAGTETMQSKRYGVEDKRYTDELKYRAERNKVEDTRWGMDFGLRKASESRLGSGGGGSSGNKSFNTDMIRLQMRNDGVDSYEDAMEWINDHGSMLFNGGVDIGTLLSEADSFKKDLGNQSEADYELYQDAVEQAKNDPRYKTLDGEDPAAFDALVDEKLKKLKGIKNPPQQASTENGNGMLTLIDWLHKHLGGKKK